MNTNTDERLERAIAAIDELIALTRESGSQSGMFLEMARLQMLLEYNEITETEFVAFCDALEEGNYLRGPCEQVPAGYARQRRSGDLRLMGRAWRQPQDSLRQRGARAGR